MPEKDMPGHHGDGTPVAASAAAGTDTVAAIAAQISRELGIPRQHVASTIRLLDEGNTIPFLARYRKEQTGGLDEEALRSVAQRLAYLRNLSERKAEVARLLEGQGVLTEGILHALQRAETLQQVEDIYRPFRPKRRTRASIARERGLEPLALWLLAHPAADDAAPAEVEAQAARFIDPEKGVATVEEALAGARDVVAEMLADNPGVRQWVRQWTMAHGTLLTRATDPEARTPYEQYYEYQEAVRGIRPHRVLAINRGEREKALRVRVEVPHEPILAYLQRRLADGSLAAAPAAPPAGPESPGEPGPAGAGAPRPHPLNPQLALVAEDAYNRLLAPAVERDVRAALTEQAETQAIRVFAANLKALLLTPPLRGKVVMGIDPAYRTGCKIAVVDPTGKLLEVGVVYPTPPQNRVAEAEATVLAMIGRHGVDLIAIGNGTASRETERFVAGLIPKAPRPVAYTIVNEAGASVYSASEAARAEFPHLDVSERSAVSIARRVQDPLAELVKIEPKSIGVGQYQHDVAEKALAEALHGVVESAVNTVGVDLNTASVELLSYVAGLSPSVAKNIVAKREAAGPFPNRQALATVPRLGPKTFEQCAGFLRVPGGGNPLDNTPIHPESYGAVETLLESLGFEPQDVVGPRRQALHEALSALDTGAWAQRLGIGRPTLTDIIEALQRPGRDPRDELPPPVLRTDVLTIDDLHPGMVLKGTVRNVVDFGAFVDIGVQQDGLVHISELSQGYVRHPLDAVSVGDVVDVVVLAVDKARNRISLSMKAVQAPSR